MKKIKISSLSIEEARKIQKEYCCWGSLSFCCSLSGECKNKKGKIVTAKNVCENRDRALELLEISKEEYIELKKKFDKELEKIILQKKKSIDEKIKKIK